MNRSLFATIIVSPLHSNRPCPGRPGAINVCAFQCSQDCTGVFAGVRNSVGEFRNVVGG